MTEGLAEQRFVVIGAGVMGHGIAQVAAMAGGGVVAAVGAVLLILDYRKASAERTAWLAPAMGRDGAMMTAGVRF